MKLSQEYKIASEYREKVHLAEDQLRTEKKNLFKAQTLLSEEKEKWAKEVKEQEDRIGTNEAEIREKETHYEEVKAKCTEAMQRTVLVEAENETLRKAIQRAKLQKEDDMCKYLLEQGNLELELSKIQDWKKEVKVSNKWKRVFQVGGPTEATGTDFPEADECLTDGEKPTGKISEWKTSDSEEITAEGEETESNNKDDEEETAFMDKLQ